MDSIATWKSPVTRMKNRATTATTFALAILTSLSIAPRARAQQSVIASGLVAGLSAGISTSLTGYAMTAIGLNTQSAYQTSVLNQLSEINDELNTISSQLTGIQDAIQTQTCVDQLSSTSVTDALTSIATVSNTYINLLQAGESSTGTVSQTDINNFLNQVVYGPGGSLPSISAALSTINIALESTDNDGIIGSCEIAVTSVPATGSFGADANFYSDPINLMQYFTDYQTVAALLLVEYYHYEAFLNSAYYSSTTITNGLSAADAAQVCANATGEAVLDQGQRWQPADGFVPGRRRHQLPICRFDRGIHQFRGHPAEQLSGGDEIRRQRLRLDRTERSVGQPLLDYAI
jgi:hypothetical protein